MERTQLISQLADIINGIHLPHPARVGIDGVDCAGKTMLADELVEPLHSLGREVIRASIDGFHNPREVRYRQGQVSPKGYFEDSFNTDAVIDCLLSPLGPGGDRKYKTALFDFRTDSVVESAWLDAPREAMLIFEGVFLHRSEFLSYWDFTIFVEAGFDVIIERAYQRDQQLFGTEENTKVLYENRYIPGQKIYLSKCRPFEKANAILKNNNVQSPELIIKKDNLKNENISYTCPS